MFKMYILNINYVSLNHWKVLLTQFDCVSGHTLLLVRVFMYNEESAQILLQHHVYVNVVYRMPAIYQTGVGSQTGHCICPALCFPIENPHYHTPTTGDWRCFVWLTFNNSAPRDRRTDGHLHTTAIGMTNYNNRNILQAIQLQCPSSECPSSELPVNPLGSGHLPSICVQRGIEIPSPTRLPLCSGFSCPSKHCR